MAIWKTRALKGKFHNFMKNCNSLLTIVMLMIIVLAANLGNAINAPKLVNEVNVQSSSPPRCQQLENQANGFDLGEGDWIKENGTRVFGGASSYTIMLPSGIYRMYFAEIDGIHSALSSDGLTWTLESGVRISPAENGSNQELICDCAAIEIPGGYRVIYEGVQGDPPNDIHRFFSATSTDGLNWVKEDGVRLESVGTPDYSQVGAPDIIVLPNGSLRMYYIGDFYHYGSMGNSIRSAISLDFGLTWTREGNRLLEEDTMDPDVIMFGGGEYKIFYTKLLRTSGPVNMSIRSAWSTDSLNWTLELGSRVAPSKSSDLGGCRHPNVIRLENGSLRMYYSGISSSGEANILSAIRLPFFAEENFALDFSESKFYFVYPNDRLSFRFKGTNIGTKNIEAFMDEHYTEPLNYVHIFTPQGDNILAPKESIWFKVLLGSPSSGWSPDPEGIYNFTLHLGFNIHPPDVLPYLDNTRILVQKTLQMKVVTDRSIGNVTIQGKIIDEEGFPIPNLEFDIGAYTNKVPTNQSIMTDRNGCFSFSVTESEAYFLVIQKTGYRGVTLKIDGNNIQDFYTITLTRETSPISVNSTLINNVIGNIGFWRCAATADESKLLLVNGMENWENRNIINQSKLHLLDVNTGEVLWTHDMGWESWSADITDDGKYVVFGTDLQWLENYPGFTNYIRLLNGTDGSIIWEKEITAENFHEYFRDGQSHTCCVKFSHNGGYVLVAVEPNYVYLLNRSDGSIKWRKWVSQNVREAIFTWDDKYVYIPSGNGHLYKLIVEDGSEVWKQWIGCWAEVNGFDLSRDEKYIAVAAKAGYLSIIDTSDGSIRFSMDGGLTCRFSPDGTMIAVGGDPTLKVLDLDGNLLWAYYNCHAADIRFSSDGSLIFCGSGQVFNIYGTLLREIRITGGGGVYQVGWLNSDATRFIWAVRDTPASENNIIEVYRIEHTPIDTTPPAIEVLSPENKTYITSFIPLTFTVNEETSWIGYSLNSQKNITISGNATLAGLSEGTYSLVIYANDTIGNMGSSNTIYFTINQTQTFHIILDNIDYAVNICSNFTVSNFLFDLTLKQINFNVTGVSFTDGFCNATIPKELLDGPFSVKVDDTLIMKVIENENATHTILYFTLTSGEYETKIIGTNVIPEFPSSIILPLFIIATMLIVMLYKRRNML